MTIFFISILALILIIYGILYFQQRRLIFHPTKLPATYHFRFSVPFEEKTFEAAGLQIHGLHFRAQNPKGMVLYFHGNAGALDNWGYAAQEIVQKSNWDVWMIDYPGYGKSGGAIVNEAQLHEVAERFYEEARKVNPRIVLFGRSIGSGMAVKLASQKQIVGLILETPYISLSSLVSELLPWVPGFLLQFTFRSDVWIGDVTAPTLVIHGTNDEVIPFLHGQKIAGMLGSRGTFVEIAGGNHNDLSLNPAYWIAIEKFLKALE